MKKDFVLYKHVNKINGKVYIGITSKNPPRLRWGLHGEGYKTHHKHFWSAIQKYGWDNFDHVIIKTELSAEEACNLELEYIKKYDALNPDHGYNTQKGGFCFTDEYRAKAGLKNHPFKGTHRSEETRRKISEGHKGLKKGIPHGPMSQETKDKISKANKGRKYNPYNHFTRPVFCIELNKLFHSATEAAEYLDLNRSAIIAAASGRHKTSGGFHWKYENEFNCINA